MVCVHQCSLFLMGFFYLLFAESEIFKAVIVVKMFCEVETLTVNDKNTHTNAKLLYL